MRHAVGCPTSLLRKRSGINLEKRNPYSVVLVVNKVTVLDGSSKVAALCSISVEVALAVVDVVNEDDLSVCHQYALRTEYYYPFFLLSSVLAITRQPETLLQRNQVQSPFPRSHAPRGRSPLVVPCSSRPGSGHSGSAGRTNDPCPPLRSTPTKNFARLQSTFADAFFDL